MGDNVLAMLNSDPMRLYRAKRDEAHRSVASKYTILGFISSGTYGRVYKAASRTSEDLNRLYAIKKFKPDKEGDVLTYTGISQSAIREIALNREITHLNVVALKEVILEDKSIYMVFEYAEHDFLQLIHHYSQTLRTSIPVGVLKSTTYQLLSGLLYLHASHILHRDLKPANILINSGGTVKIGDLGLARLARAPLAPLYAGDKVVVTIWYRAPELLLGARHYTRAVDCWAVGCVLAELAALRPIFKGEEARPDAAARKGAVPFQREQMLRVLEVLGNPREDEWPGLSQMPEYAALRRLENHQPALDSWCAQRGLAGSAALLLHGLFTWDPARRLDSRKALEHRWFTEEPKPQLSVFANVPASQLPPARRVSQEDGAPGLVNPPMAPVAAPGTQSTAGSAFGVLSGGHAVHSRKKARLN